jgi:hypothetical protein
LSGPVVLVAPDQRRASRGRLGGGSCFRTRLCWSRRGRTVDRALTAKMRRKAALNLHEMVGGSRRGRTFDTFVVWQPPGGTEAKKVCLARHSEGFRPPPPPERADRAPHPANPPPQTPVLAFSWLENPPEGADRAPHPTDSPPSIPGFAFSELPTQLEWADRVRAVNRGAQSAEGIRQSTLQESEKAGHGYRSRLHALRGGP